MNERLAQMLGDDGGLYPHQAEAKYPRIVQRISNLWGTAGMSRYFTEILFDDRGDREGFPPEVMLELFALSNYHESTKPSRSAIDSAWQSSEGDRLDRFKDKS
jgi:uncharacterized protein